MFVTFQQVFEVASRRFSPETWRMFNQTEQASAIYQEMRRMDAEAARQEQEEASHRLKRLRFPYCP